MRPLSLRDLRDAARALLAAPTEERKDLCRRLIWETHSADRCFRRLRRYHHAWGDGSLGDRARKETLAEERWLNDAEYASCLSMVLDGLSERRSNLR